MESRIGVRRGVAGGAWEPAGAWRGVKAPDK
jgi:hypothetical protein